MKYCCEKMDHCVKSGNPQFVEVYNRHDLVRIAGHPANYCPFCGTQYPLEEPQPPSGQWAVRELKAGRMVEARKGDTPWVAGFTRTPYKWCGGALEVWKGSRRQWRRSEHCLSKISEHDIWQPAEDPQPKPETVEREIDWNLRHPHVLSPGGTFDYIVTALIRNDCLGYVFEGLEFLDDEQLSQMPVMWVRVKNSWDMPLYLYHPPCSNRSRFYERRKAYAMRFKGEDSGSGSRTHQRTQEHLAALQRADDRRDGPDEESG